MSAEIELKRLHGRLESFVKHSSGATLIAMTFGTFNLFMFMLTLRWPPEEIAVTWLPDGQFWLIVASFSFGVAASFVFINVIKRIVETSRTEWEEDQAIESSSEMITE